MLPSGVFASMKKSLMKELVVGALVCWSQGEVADVDMEDLGSDGMEDFNELGTVIIAEGDSRNRDSGPQLPVKFGCKWDPVDYSCTYDCVFTTFAWIYFHATNTWQRRWEQESATTKLLSGHFGSILASLSGPTPDHTIPALFAKGRDTWRDRVSEYHPTEFPRRGPKYVSVTRILEVLANDCNPSHYATVLLPCGTTGCPLRAKNLEARYYMLTPTDWNTSTGRTSTPYLKSLETWINKHYSSPRLTKTAERCGWCQQRFSRKLVFRQPIWTWFEVFPEFRHVIVPAQKISLRSATLQLTAVIYFGNMHYWARLCEPSGTWWFYDGQRYRGQPTLLSGGFDEGDLFQCGSDFVITALVYCLID